MANSDNNRTIDHDGIVQRNEDNKVIVAISASSACSGCHAEGSCSLSGHEEKLIEVQGKYDVRPGDAVTVLMKQSMGYTALFLGYLLPLIIVVSLLVALVSFKVPELASGLISLVVLIPYYFIVFLFRKTVNNKFTFTLKV
jgi:sigma-E factor negative regulatory protein RseC